MSETIPPYMRVLFTLLAKPNSLRIAESMIKRLMYNREPSLSSHLTQKLVEEPECDCVMMEYHFQKSSSVCLDFHWTCMLKHLTERIIKVDEVGSKLTSCPRILTLPTLVQQNLLLLLIKFRSLLPHCELQEFIATLEDTVDRKDWVGYLIRKLKCITHIKTKEVLSSRLTERHSSASEINCVPVHRDSLMSVSKALSLSILQPTVTSITDSNCTLVTDRDDDVEITQVLSRKRPLEVDENGKCVKKAKIQNIEVSPLDELMTDSNQKREKCSETTVKISSIIAKWNSGQPGVQSDFEEVVSSTEFSRFIEDTASQNYAESGIVAFLTNMLNLSIDISYLNLSSCFRDLLTNQILKLDKTISRALLSLAKSLLEKHGFVFIDGFFSTLICHRSFGANHCTFVCKMIKDVMSEEHRTRLWNNIVAANFSMYEGGGLIWGESVITCLSTLVEKGILCDSKHQECVQSLQRNAAHHSKSLVFAKLLVSLVLKYGRKFADFKDTFKEIAIQNKTPLRLKLLKQFN